MHSGAPKAEARGRGWAVAIGGIVLGFIVGAMIHSTQLVNAPETVHMGRNTMMKHVKFSELIDRGYLYLPNGMLYRLINAANDMGWTREVALLVVLGVSTAAIWYATYRYAQRLIGGDYAAAQVGLVAALTMVVNALYFPVYSINIYLGKWGPNVYHNPTHTLVLAFAVPSFVAIGFLLSRPGTRKDFWVAAALSVVLALSIYAKPTFMIILAPATVAYALIVRGISVRTVGILFALFIVPTAYLLLQRYFAMTVDGSRFAGRTSIVAPFWVWNHFTRSVPMSMALTFAFPVALAASGWREFKFGRHFGYAWMLCLVATALAILLVEVRPPNKMQTSANWFGGYLLANHMLFMVAIVEFFRWRLTLGPEGRKRLRYRLCTVLLALHMASGFLYLWRLSYMRGTFA